MTSLTSEPFTETVVHFFGKGLVSHLRSIDAIKYNGDPEKVPENYPLLNNKIKYISTTL